MGSNKFYQKEDYWVMTIKTKGTVHEEYFNGEELEILFDGDEETINKIKNSNWYLWKENGSKNTYYVITNNYNKTEKRFRLHRAVFGENIPINMLINHKNRLGNGWKDNRRSNLELTTSEQNARNKSGAGYPLKNGQGWRYKISMSNCAIHTPTRKSYEQADIDALIIQEYFNYTHRQSEWYKTKKIDQEYKDELIGLMNEKLKRTQQNKKTFNKNRYEIVKINEKEILKVFDNKDRFCYMDKEELQVLDLGRLRENTKGYWLIKINNKEVRLHRFLLGIAESDKFYNLDIDHLNNMPYDNRKSNLIITTEKGNNANKKSRCYSFVSNFYKISYKCYYFFIKKHNMIKNSEQAYFKTENEAKEEVYKRKYLANYIRPQFKNLNEYLTFEEEYNLNKKDGQTLDEYWIITRFPDINNIKIPKFSEERVDKL